MRPIHDISLVDESRVRSRRDMVLVSATRDKTFRGNNVPEVLHQLNDLLVAE